MLFWNVENEELTSIAETNANIGIVVGVILIVIGLIMLSKDVRDPVKTKKVVMFDIVITLLGVCMIIFGIYVTILSILGYEALRIFIRAISKAVIYCIVTIKLTGGKLREKE